MHTEAWQHPNAANPDRFFMFYRHMSSLSERHVAPISWSMHAVRCSPLQQRVCYLFDAGFKWVAAAHPTITRLSTGAAITPLRCAQPPLTCLPACRRRLRSRWRGRTKWLNLQKREADLHWALPAERTCPRYSLALQHRGTGHPQSPLRQRPWVRSAFAATEQLQ